MAILVEDNIPIYETRGRPPSEEHVTLLMIGVGKSFVSHKKRQALYQMAKTLGIKVKILSDVKSGGWRIWKQSPQLAPDELKKWRAKMRAERIAARKARLVHENQESAS